MAQGHISELLASLTDLNENVDVEDISVPMGSPTLVQWTKAQVKQRFETEGSLLQRKPFCCPRLLTITIPTGAIALGAATPIPTDKTAISQRMSQDPFWVARRMLMLNGFVASNRCDAFGSYLFVEQGLLFHHNPREIGATIRRWPCALRPGPQHHRGDFGRHLAEGNTYGSSPLPHDQSLQYVWHHGAEGHPGYRRPHCSSETAQW